MKNKIVAFTLLFFFLAPRVFAKHQEPGPNLSKNQNDLPSCNEQDAQKLEEWVMKLIPNTNQNKNTVPIPQQKTNIVEALDVIAWGNDEARRVSQENLRKLKDKGIDIAPLAISYYQDFKNHGTKTDLKESVAQRLYKFTLKELEIDVTSQIPVKESRPAQSTPRDEFKDYSAAKSAFGLLNEKDIPLEKFPAFIDQVSEITASANPFYCEAPGDIHALRDKTLRRVEEHLTKDGAKRLEHLWLNDAGVTQLEEAVNQSDDKKIADLSYRFSYLPSGIRASIILATQYYLKGDLVIAANILHAQNSYLENIRKFSLPSNSKTVTEKIESLSSQVAILSAVVGRSLGDKKLIGYLDTARKDLRDIKYPEGKSVFESGVSIQDGELNRYLACAKTQSKDEKIKELERYFSDRESPSPKPFELDRAVGFAPEYVKNTMAERLEKLNLRPGMFTKQYWPLTKLTPLLDKSVTYESWKSFDESYLKSTDMKMGDNLCNDSEKNRMVRHLPKKYLDGLKTDDWLPKEKTFQDIYRELIRKEFSKVEPNPTDGTVGLMNLYARKAKELGIPLESLLEENANHILRINTLMHVGSPELFQKARKSLLKYPLIAESVLDFAPGIYKRELGSRESDVERELTRLANEAFKLHPNHPYVLGILVKRTPHDLKTDEQIEKYKQIITNVTAALNDLSSDETNVENQKSLTYLLKQLAWIDGKDTNKKEIEIKLLPGLEKVFQAHPKHKSIPYEVSSILSQIDATARVPMVVRLIEENNKNSLNVELLARNLKMGNPAAELAIESLHEKSLETPTLMAGILAGVIPSKNYNEFYAKAYKKYGADPKIALSFAKAFRWSFELNEPKELSANLPFLENSLIVHKDDEAVREASILAINNLGGNANETTRPILLAQLTELKKREPSIDSNFVDYKKAIEQILERKK